MASIYKRTDSSYWWIKLGANESALLNKSRSFSSREKTKKGATVLLDNIKKEILKAQHSEDRLPTPQSYISLKDAFNMYVSHRKSIGKKLSAATLEAYDKALNYFFAALPDKNITEYQKPDYYNFIAAMGKVSQNTQAIYSNRIHAIFNFLLKENLIRSNPMEVVAEEHKPIKTIPKEHIEKLLAKLKGRSIENCVKFMLISAFRANEALGVRWSDITKKEIMVKGKGGKHDSIPITKRMKEFLAALPKEKADEKLFPFSYSTLRTTLYRLNDKNKLGFQPKTHDFRKYRISELANAGVNIFYAMKYARHSDIKTTLKYYASADKENMGNEIDEKVDDNDDET